MMPNSYPSDGIFNSHQATIIDSFSCMVQVITCFSITDFYMYLFTVSLAGARWHSFYSIQQVFPVWRESQLALGKHGVLWVEGTKFLPAGQVENV